MPRQDRRRSGMYSRNGQMNQNASPFEEPAQSPELRQERSPDLYRATNPFWNQPLQGKGIEASPPDVGEPPRTAQEPSIWQHPDVLDTDSYTEAKHPKRKRRVILSVVLVLGIIVLAASLVLGMMRVRKIKVTGNAGFSAEAIIALSQIKIGQFSLVNETEIINKIEQNPYLICKRVSLESFDTICIEVKERQEVTFLTTSGIGVITDAHGYVLRTVSNANESHPELIKVQGLSIKMVIIGQKLIASQQAPLNAMTEILLQLKVMGGLDQIAILDISSTERLTMQTMDGMEIVLGDSEQLHEKLRAFLLVREELSDMGISGGTLVLSDPVNPIYTPADE